MFFHAGGSPYHHIPIDEFIEILKKGYRLERPHNCRVDM